MTLFHYSLLSMLLVVWGVLTSILVLLLVLRGVAGMHEDNLLYLNEGEKSFAQETQHSQAQQRKLMPYIKAFGWMSGVMALGVAGVFVYQNIFLTM